MVNIIHINTKNVPTYLQIFSDDLNLLISEWQFISLTQWHPHVYIYHGSVNTYLNHRCKPSLSKNRKPGKRVDTSSRLNSLAECLHFHLIIEEVSIYSSANISYK